MEILNIKIKKDAINHFIFISTAFFFLLFLFGWYRAPGQYIWGLYTDTDGQFAEWYSKSLFQWSHPFYISNINPFEGICSLFFPNNIWLNPGALALSLPLERIWTYLFSYGIYLAEVSISVYFLGRALSLSRIQSVIAAQIFAFFLFPPFTAYTHATSFFSGAPFNAHLMALLNFALVFFIRLGRSANIYKNASDVFFIIVISCVAFYSGAFTLLTFLPFYGIFALGVFVQDLRNSNKKVSLFLWKIVPLILLLFLGLILDSYHYFSGTTKYVSRALTISPPAAHFTLIDYIKGIFEAFLKYSPCTHPQESMFCLQEKYPISFFHLIAGLGGVISCFTHKYRWIAFSFIFIAFSPEVLIILAESRLFPKLMLINPKFFVWSSYCFSSLFFTIFFGEIWKTIKIFLALDPFFNTFRQTISSPLGRAILNGAWLVFVVPLTALYYYITIELYKPVPIPPSEKTDIVAHLEKEIKVKPQEIFKGYTISYLGAEGGGIRPHLDLAEGYLDSSVQYTKAREYLKKHYKNSHMLSDLWKYDIPTLEEYGQWITIPLYLFTGELLSKPGAHLYNANINIFGLNYSVLQTIGVRFIITDSQLTDLKLREVKQITKEGAVPLYLYEIQNPNLGNYSPTQVVVLNSAKDIFNLFKSGTFNFEDYVVLQQAETPQVLSKAYDTHLLFDINKIKVTSKSPGTSLIVLPFQFSHCYKVNPQVADSSVKVMRANIVQTAILFRDKLDIELIFDFGMTRNAKCRERDIREIKDLNLIQ